MRQLICVVNFLIWAALPNQNALAHPRPAIGWTNGTAFHRTQGLMNSTLVVAREDRVLTRIEAEYPFIQSWEFSENDTCVVILSGPAHGPGRLEKFRIGNGKLVDACYESETTPFEQKPGWAKTFLINQENHSNDAIAPARQ